MSMFAHMAAGVAQGFGAGMGKAQEVLDRDRRDAALEAVRKEAVEREWELKSQFAAASAKRDFDATRALANDNRNFTLQVGKATAEAQAAARREERDWSVQDREDKQQFDATQAAKERAAQMERDFGKPIDSFTDENTGDVTMVYRGGRTEKYKGVAKKAPTLSSNLGSNPFATEPLSAAAQPNYVWDPKKGFQPQGGN